MARTLWKAGLAGMALAVSLVLVGAVGMSPASAAEPAPITDYASYPNVTPSIIPEGCTADGPRITVGEEFVVTNPGDDPETVTDLRDLEAPTMVPGTVIEMSWSGFAAGCDTAGISLSAKRAASPSFDPDTEQTLIASAYDYCGPLAGADPCVLDGGRYRLAITLPAEAACFYQVDAVVGPPLLTVWNADDAEGNPLGSFYSDDTRVANGRQGGFNMLISAANGGLGECDPPPPPCEWDPELPADDPGCFEPCEYDPEVPADDPSCQPPPPPCEWDPELPADDPGCFEPCEYDPEVPADDPSCQPPPPPCEWDPELPADDPGCFEPCEYDPEVPADDPACEPPSEEPCEYDPELPADDPACEPPSEEPCELDPTKSADDPTCGESVGGVVVRPTPTAPTQLPATGSEAAGLVDPAALLIGAGATLVAVGRRRRAAA